MMSDNLDINWFGLQGEEFDRIHTLQIMARLKVAAQVPSSLHSISSSGKAKRVCMLHKIVHKILIGVQECILPIQ